MPLLLRQTVRRSGVFRRAKKYFWIGACPPGAGVGLAEAMSCESPAFMRLAGIDWKTHHAAHQFERRGSVMRTSWLALGVRLSEIALGAEGS